MEILKYVACSLLFASINLITVAQSQVPLATIYHKGSPLVQIEKQKNEYVFYRIQDGSCLGRWDGQQVYVAQSRVQKGITRGGQWFDAQQRLLYTVEEAGEGKLLINHPLIGTCRVIQYDLPLLFGTEYHWQWHTSATVYQLLYTIAIYFVYFHPTPLC
ncbi:hypothetical protein FHS56_000882 [Thermonema lapsum]|uniref:Uncharacterized protein n=1 Tax=Thermonema lapsum TaxID=28195 RepID=A0A846MPA5_9BACT|nr:hypothetical protein [Thermonema lapsum]NIK73396.1 hypothetical protein [Thermonema lapsum]